MEHFRALRSAGLEVDIVPIDADLAGYRAVITPALYLLEKESARRLSSFVADGGCWVATYLTGYVDGSNRCWLGGFPGPDLREVFGLWNEEVDYLFDGETVVVRGCADGLSESMRATDVIEHVRAEGATPLAVLDSEFYAGSPAILRNRWKKGSTCYIGARLDEESLVSFYRFLASDLDLPLESLPQGVVRKIRLGVEGSVEFLFNYTKREAVVDLGDESFVRISDGLEVTAKTTLRAYETLLRSVKSGRSNLSPFSTNNSLQNEPHELPISVQT